MLNDIEIWVGQPLPSSYRRFLASQGDDLPVGDFVLLYGQTSFIERNETYETKRYCPNHITIGDDSGGRQILLSLDTGPLSLVDAGSMNPAFAEHISEDLTEWLSEGCPLPNED